MQIHCFEVINNVLEGGALIFETNTTAHTQYIASSPDGKKSGALDFLFSHLISETFSHKDFFSFGSSNERAGRELNRGLCFWKEGFGARSIPVDTYEIQIANYRQLEQYA